MLKNLGSDEGIITKATIHAKIAAKDITKTFEESGLIGVYNLGMQHMLDYICGNVKYDTESENDHMVTIDRALSIYSDKIATGENVNIEEICAQLNEADKKEFIELAEMSLMTMNLDAKITNQSFDEFFEKLNAYKESVYGK